MHEDQKKTLIKQTRRVKKRKSKNEIRKWKMSLSSETLTLKGLKSGGFYTHL